MRGRKSPFAILLVAFLLLSSAAAKAEDLDAALLEMRAERCPSMPGWDCVTQEVPLDHRASAGPTIKIKYVIHRAKDTSKGVLVFAVGGPGQSGIAVAESWLESYKEELRKSMDIVFFDQRGVGPDRGGTCPNALTRFKMAQSSISKPDEAIAIAKAFATDCPAEFKPRAHALLDVLDTEQAIRDLEMFRQAIGGPMVWIYGASYGTQFAQQYASAFPAAVKGVIIDGVVDLTLGYDDYEASSVTAAEEILTRVFDACSPETECGADMKGDAARIYEALSARAAEKPIEVNFPQVDGTFTKRELTRYMLESSAYNALSDSDQRAAFLRALAAASRKNLVPLLQLSYESLLVDSRSMEATRRPTDYYEAAYYAITCSEYGEGTDDRDATARQIVERARDFSPKAPRLLEFFYMERLVCAFWPKRGPTERPKPYAGGEFPTLIINADTDPITPLSMSESVFDHAKEASEAAMVIARSGPHVSWGYGVSCVDNPVYDLVLRGKMPGAQPPCEQSFIDYTRLTLADGVSADNAHSVVTAAETEIVMSPEFRKWSKELRLHTGGEKESLTIGCDFGGTMTASGNKYGKHYSFTGCAWWPNIVLSGTGAQVSVKGSESIKLDLAISGEHSGKIAYGRDIAAKAETWSGDYDGKDVSAP